MKENLNSDTIEKIFDEHISVIKESKSSVVAKIDAAVDLVSKSLTSKGTIFGVEMEVVQQTVNI